MKLNRSSMLYGTLVLTLTSIISQVLGFVYRIFLSRLIGAEVMGLYQLIMPVYSVIMSLTAIGLTVAVSNLSAEYQALGNPRAVVQLLRKALTAFLVLFALVAGVTVLLYDPISVHLLGDARTQLGLLLLLPCILLTGIENLHKHYFYGTGNIRPPAAVELTEQLIRTGAVLGLLVLLLPQYPERVVGIIVAGMCCSELFSSVTLVILFRWHMGRPSALAGPGEEPRRLSRRMGAIALPIAATALLGNLMGSANAVLIPQRLVHAGMDVSAAMSAFGVLCGMTVPMLCLPTAFIGAMGLVLVPKLSQSVALGRMDEVRRRIHKALLATSVLVMPALAILVVLGPTIGVYLFREATVGRYMVPLSVGVLLSCYQSVLSGVLSGIGRQAAAARSSLLCGGVQLGCTWVLMGLPGVGLGGYVAGFVLSSALGSLLNYWEVSRRTGLKSRLFQWCTAPALSALLMGLVINLLFRILLDAGMDSAAACLACILFGGVLYLAALSAQGVRPSRLFRLR
ncbi:polysaccharide biosynthesis C-terminal domain-containing protein [uncultured Pseudoflavonifractor sp.]|uniref:putative polysaccharide biosynthesis protein n=1 Tax=uncultured Pseudoflavonifractor sp. TaxID=1221379 RepID=UPI0025CBAA27|nr:polysaccharide biosynthesis C-terminal domain-containing protein [uncultured Pseudoflavonifractor sp.]